MAQAVLVLVAQVELVLVAQVPLAPVAQVAQVVLVLVELQSTAVLQTLAL